MNRLKILSVLGPFLLVPMFIWGDEVAVSSGTESKQIIDLKGCLDIGAKNYEPLKLADEEVELARLKRDEAQRAFFPSVSFKAEETHGETSDILVSPDFKERVYGAAINQDIYQGGKVYSVYRQSEASFRAAEKSREKTWQDFVFGVQEAYWKLSGAQNSFKEREIVRDQIKADLKVVTEQYVLDLAVKQQFLAVKAQYLQANNQANAAHVAFAKSRWNLAKALGLPKPPDFEVQNDIPYQKIEVDLEDCLSLAAGHRPDLRMQEELVEIAREGRKAASAANLPKVSLNTFYGRSASAYERDPLIFKEDWQVNARISQAFWGNTMGVSGSQINTSPKLGQSTRTRTDTKGFNLNLLDGMKDRTDIKQAGLAERQAELKKNDLRKDVAIDVEDAYYNLNQTSLQVEFSDEDFKLAQEELKVAQSKGKYGLSSILELAQARNRYATSRVSRWEALASYRIALAALNRTVGIVDKFKVE